MLVLLEASRPATSLCLVARTVRLDHGMAPGLSRAGGKEDMLAKASPYGAREL